MIVKEKFILLRDTPNVINVSSGSIKKYSIPGDIQNVVRSIKLVEKQISHFTKKKVLYVASNISVARKEIEVVNIPDYPIPVTYNKSTKKIVLNLNPLNVNEVSKLDTRTVYGMLAYGICLRALVQGKTKLKDSHFAPMVGFLNTLFVRVYGKEFGLLGVYSVKLPKLKFLLSCYILGSFFGITGNTAYKKSSAMSGYNYKDEIDLLKRYDFTRIDSFIKSLSDLKVMPGLNKITFTKKILQYFGLNFIPAMEDVSRFLSSIVTSNISGSTIVPSFIYTYNNSEFDKLLTLTKSIFK